MSNVTSALPAYFDLDDCWQTYQLNMNSNNALFNYAPKTNFQLIDLSVFQTGTLNFKVMHFQTTFVLHVDMRANSRDYSLSEGALIGLLHGSKPLESVALLNFRSQLASNPLSTAVLFLRGHLQLRSYKGVFL